MIGMCVAPPGAAALTPLAIGVGLAALVYSCGHISKAHFNPATTVTYFCAGTHTRKEFLPFVAVIFLGAILAALTVQWLNPLGIQMVAPIKIDFFKVIIAEFSFTFALMWVILNVAIARGTNGNQFYGIAIGAGLHAFVPVDAGATEVSAEASRGDARCMPQTLRIRCWETADISGAPLQTSSPVSELCPSKAGSRPC